MVGCCERAGYFSDSEDSLAEIIGIVAAVDADDTRLPFWLNALGRVRAAQGKVNQGLQAANDALDRNERHFGKVSRQVADTMSILGDPYIGKGALGEAERCLDFARDIYVGTGRADAPELVKTLERLDEIQMLKR